MVKCLLAVLGLAVVLWIAAILYFKGNRFWPG